MKLNKIFWMIVFSLIIMQGIQVNADLNSSLIGYWSMNELSGTAVADSTGNNANGTSSATAIVSSCKLGACLNFNPGSAGYVSIPNNAIQKLNPLNQSFNAWIYINSSRTKTGVNDLTIISKQNGVGYPDYAITIRNTTVSSLVGFYQATSTNSIFTQPNIVQSNNWSMYTVVRENATLLKYYINGNLINTSYPVSNAGSSSTDALLLGAWRAGALESFNGMLDEIAMWNRSLSQTEINQLYNSGFGLAYPFSSSSISINLTSPANNQIIYDNQNITYNWTCNGPQINYTGNISENGIIIHSFNATINNTPTTITHLNGFGSFSWNVTCNNTISTTNTYTIYNTSSKYSINIRDWLGVLISSTDIYDNYLNSESNNNPYQVLLGQYFNDTNTSKQITYNITDLTYKHIPAQYTLNITLNQTEYNITMSPNQLSLTFYKAGVLVNTSGFIADENKTRNWTLSSFVVIQQNLTKGLILIGFARNGSENHTQFYEYMNDYTTHISENIEIMQASDWYIYIRVRDQTGVPIGDATIRIKVARPETYGGNWSYFNLAGQRLTQEDGLTFFYLDKKTPYILQISADGYEPLMLQGFGGDEAYTKDAPLEVKLKVATANNTIGVYTYLPSTYTNSSIKMNGTIYAPGKTSVTITTDYQQALGLNPTTLSKDTLDRYTYSLVPGIHLNASTNCTNVTVMIRADGEIAYNKTIVCDLIPKKSIASQANFTSIDDNVKNPIIWILLIFLSAGAGYIFKNENVSVGTFKIGMILVSAMSLSFLWLTMLVIIEWAMKTLKKVISE